MAGKTDNLSDRWTLSGKLSCVCQESPVGIEDEAVAVKTVYKYVLIISCKIYFVFLFFVV